MECNIVVNKDIYYSIASEYAEITPSEYRYEVYPSIYVEQNKKKCTFVLFPKQWKKVDLNYFYLK